MKDLLFYELVRVALGNQQCLSRTPTEEEWRLLFDMAEKQAVDGITYDALAVLAKQGQKPIEDVMLDWFSYAEQIKEQNRIVNQRCKDITELFAEAGYKTCILKGQGNAQMYSNPLLRVSGDIDIWVIGNTYGKGVSRQEITDFVRQRCPDAFEQYHHIDYPIYDDVPVEVHYTPGSLLSPKQNKRFQQWCEEQKKVLMNEQHDCLEVVYPSVAFNAGYQMAHMMVHFFIEGIGLRHFVDYYYVLRCMMEDGRGMKEEDPPTSLCREAKDPPTDPPTSLHREDYKSLFEDLGMLKFARGVMWIEKELLGLDERYLIAEPSEKIGRLIKKEIEEGGNFGHHDERYSKMRKKGFLARGMVDGYRLLTMANYFPAETFWKIVNKIGNQKWKIKGQNIERHETL